MTLSAAQLNGHTGDNEIGTPDDLFADLHRRFDFNYDAFAGHKNALLYLYSTENGTFFGRLPLVEQAHQATGLTFPWEGRRVFWNPPYGRGIYLQCIEKAIEERNNVEISVGLLKYDASTETGRLIRENFHIEYLPRIQYKGMKTAAPFASVIAINRPDRWSPRKDKA